MKSASARSVVGVRAILQSRFGEPSVLEHVELPDPEPGPGHVRIDVRAAGVHVIDTSIRRGDADLPFPPPALPTTPGREVAGVVGAVGPDVDATWLGRRVVGHLGMAGGGYASQALAAVAALHALPEHVPYDAAVAAIGTGRTTHGVLDVARLTRDDVVLVTAAAGGMGVLFLQAARAVGAAAVGLAGGPDKTAVVRSYGAAAVDYLADDWPARVRDVLCDRRPTVVLDGVGGAVATAAIDLLAPGGRHVAYGASSGSWVAVDADLLYRTGVWITSALGPHLFARRDLRALETAALAAAADGTIVPLVGSRFPLADAAAAHAAIEARATTGKVVLVP